MARGSETTLQLNQERIAYWTGQGAQPSARVTLMLKTAQKDKAINKAAPTKAELKTAQIAASRQAAKVKAKAEAETATAAEPEAAEKSE
ncbi:MAG: hypothetical protein ACD_42C00493G0004 [uncultured bacterium]|nr:MAG: hypothetical protein ACD_42C00493G0004 [uncultured bacterium]